MPLLDPFPNVTYVPGDLALSYDTNEVNDTDISMTFGYSPSSEDTPDPDFQAVMYAYDVAEGRCLFDQVLAVSSADAHLVDGVSGPPDPQPFNILGIDTTNPNDPVLHIDTPFVYFGDTDYYLYYSQNAQCSDDVGNEDNPTGPKDQCGRFDVCVEFQALVCGIKVDFVDVHVELEFYLSSRCDGCLDAILKRDETVDDGYDVGSYPIKCYHCDAENDPTTGALIPVEVNNGDTIKACLNLETPVPRACIHSIVYLDFMVAYEDSSGATQETTYEVYPPAVEGEDGVFLTGMGAFCGIGNLAGQDSDGSYNGALLN